MKRIDRRIAATLLAAGIIGTPVLAQSPKTAKEGAPYSKSRAANPSPAHPLTRSPAHASIAGPVIDKQWAFHPPVRVTPPHVRLPAAGNPIDAFVRSRLEGAELTQSAPADRYTLIRRVSFDLTGLPPTPAEVAAFVSDGSPRAYEKVVDRLLASQGYGERWARHWLDLARYSDSEGFKSDEMRPDAWRYRDYVIRSFNADKPYDRFLKEQVAGDELAPDDPDARIATAFCRHWADESNARDIMLRRQEILNDITDTTVSTMLGLTAGCARCHDHKYDPISQKDYYRIQAFFAAVQARDDVSVLPAGLEAERLRKQQDWEAKTAAIRARLATFERPYRARIQVEKCGKFPDDVKLAAFTEPDKRTPIQWALYRKAESQIGIVDADIITAMKTAKPEDQKRHAELRSELAKFDLFKPVAPPRALGITDVGPEAPKTFRLAGGVYDKHAEEVEPGYLSAVSSRPPSITARRNSTGRRIALAEWIASAENPLTARVFVNRLWQHHFGRGIVPTSSDFGAAGERPTHPELLDWLATEFVRVGWSVKQMQRLIVTSATYTQSADFSPAAARIDPENKLLWRFGRQRLEGESIRDAMLAVSGTLSPGMGGPAVMAELPAAVTTRGYWKSPTDPAELGRRSIYVFVKRNMRYPLFDAFDFPDTHEPCARRQVTTTAPQALLLLNDDAVLKMALAFADRVAQEAGKSREAQVDRAYVLAFGRPARYEEKRAAIAFLDRQFKVIAAKSTPVASAGSHGAIDPAAAKPGGVKNPAPISPERAALADFCHALFNANEFCHVE